MFSEKYFILTVKYHHWKFSCVGTMNWVFFFSKKKKMNKKSIKEDKKCRNWIWCKVECYMSYNVFPPWDLKKNSVFIRFLDHSVEIMHNLTPDLWNFPSLVTFLVLFICNKRNKRRECGQKITKIDFIFVIFFFIAVL